MEDSQRNISSLVFDIEAVADGDLIARICAISVSLISLKRRFRGLPQRGLWPQPNGNQGQRVEESKRRKGGVRVEIATFGLFDFSTPTLHSSKNLRRKQNFEAFVIRNTRSLNDSSISESGFSSNSNPLTCRFFSGRSPLSFLLSETSWIIALIRFIRAHR